jgi:hypothetical protein
MATVTNGGWALKKQLAAAPWLQAKLHRSFFKN